MHYELSRKNRTTGWIFMLLLVALPLSSVAQSSRWSGQDLTKLLEQRPEQAIQVGQRLYQTARKAKDQANANFYAQYVGQAYYETGNAAYKGGRYLQGIQYAGTGLRWMTTTRVASDTLPFQLSLLVASLYGRLPLADSASHWYAQTNRYLAHHPTLNQLLPNDVCGYYMSYAYFLSRNGDSQRAFDYLQVAAKLAQKAKNRRLLAIVNNYLGNYFFQVRHFDQADGYYRNALQGYQAGSIDQCWGYVILGNNDRAAGRPAAGWESLLRGQQLYKKNMALQPQTQNIDFEIQLNYYSAECLRALNNSKAAEAAYRACIAVYQRNYGSRGEFIAASWLGLGYLAQHQSHNEQALMLAQEGVKASSYQLEKEDSPTNFFGAIISEKSLYESLRLEADLWQSEWLARRTSNALSNAVRRYEQALAVAAWFRRNLIPQESKFFLSNDVVPCVEQAIASCFELAQHTKQDSDRNRLFQLLERHRMMTTADLLHEKYRLANAIPPRVAAREQVLRQQKMDGEKAVANAPDSSNRTRLQHQLHVINVASYQFLDSLERAYPRYFALKYAVKAFDIGQVQQNLPNNAAYLSYYLGDGYLLCFLIGKTNSHVRKVLLPRSFAPTVRQLWQALRRDPGMFMYTGHPQAVALYQALIRPIQQELRPFRRLLISRDGVLHHIPFDLLQPTGTTTEYLGKTFAISYSYSAELTFPSFSEPADTPPRIAGFAPYSLNRQSGALLPESLSEVQTWGGRVFADRDATKKAFLEAAPQSDVVVLATHAVADEKKPEQSFIAFHPTGSDSLLRAIEIVNLSLSHLKLVILSACQGNTGALQPGEGLLSLARAFRLAGCQTILTTSWKASDESTAVLTGLFQQYIANGLPTDLALQQARSDFLTDKRFRKWRHPYHWANFTLIGPPTTLYQAPGLSVPTAIDWGIGFVVLVLSVWLIRRRLVLGSSQPL